MALLGNEIVHSIERHLEETKLDATGEACFATVSEDEELITGPEVDKWLRISPVTRWRWIKSGKLPIPVRLHPTGPNIFRKKQIKAIVDSAQPIDIYQNDDQAAK